MKSITAVVAMLLAATPILAATTTSASTTTATVTGVEEKSAEPTLNTPVVQGCFASSGELVLNGTLKFNSKSSCALDTCLALGYKVAGTTGGNKCYCGNKYPPKSSVSNDTNCNIGCSGYDIQACK
jgi:cell wall integrity and stress response component